MIIIQATSHINSEVDLSKLYELLNDIYSNDEVFLDFSNKTKLKVKLKRFYTINKTTKKKREPYIIFYKSGAVMFFCNNKKILNKCFDFTTRFINENYENIVEEQIFYNDKFIDNYYENN